MPYPANITHLGSLEVAGVPTLGSPGIMTTFGTVFYVNSNTDEGSDSNDGLTMESAKATVLAAYNLTTSNAHDVVVMSGSSAHVFADELIVAKNRVHFIGLGGGSRYLGQRTRWTMGVTTGSAIALLQVTGVGCTFTNIKMTSADTLAASLYCVADGGEFTQFTNCWFEKNTDLNQTTAAEFLCNSDTGYYLRCTFGNNIYTVSVARQSVLCTRETITGKVARDCIWEDCLFQQRSTASTNVNIRATGNDLERMMLFRKCIFWNAKGSSGLQSLAFGIASVLTDAEVLLDRCTLQNIVDVAAASRGVFTNSVTPIATGTESVEVTTT